MKTRKCLFLPRRRARPRPQRTPQTPRRDATSTMHTTTAAAAATTAAASAVETSPDRGYIARLSGALAALLSHRHAEGAELSEDELLGGLRKARLTSYEFLPAPQRAQGGTPRHRLLVRLSAALAEELAGPY